MQLLLLYMEEKAILAHYSYDITSFGCHAIDVIFLERSQFSEFIIIDGFTNETSTLLKERFVVHNLL